MKISIGDRRTDSIIVTFSFTQCIILKTSSAFAINMTRQKWLLCETCSNNSYRVTRTLWNTKVQKKNNSQFFSHQKLGSVVFIYTFGVSFCQRSAVFCRIFFSHSTHTDQSLDDRRYLIMETLREMIVLMVNFHFRPFTAKSKLIRR